MSRESVWLFGESNHFDLFPQNFQHREHLFPLLDIAPKILLGVDDKHRGFHVLKERDR